MSSHRAIRDVLAAGMLVAIIGSGAAFAQDAPKAAQAPAPAVAPAQPQAPAPPPQFVSADVDADRKITFRLYAPKATAVRLNAGDIPGLSPQTSALTNDTTGVWSVTVGPVPPGAYRYMFNVDGVATVDPRSSAISESNANVWSLVLVPGRETFDTRETPHGAVSAVTYRSTALGTFRRMHVYTPPGYDLGSGTYPVFYLLHGAGDNDHAWSSVGRAGIILDNLIAAKKAVPMIVVMPAGHTPRVAGSPVAANATQAFVGDFVQDIMPYVESHYRVRKDRASTAIAGLSMGGSQTLAVAIPRLGRFGYVAVFSSGLIGAFPDLMRRPTATGPARAPQGPPPQTADQWAQEQAATLDNPALKKGLRLFWFATGKDDFLLTTTQATVDLLKKHQFDVVFRETDGGHTWLKWRDYLEELAPQLFQPATR